MKLKFKSDVVLKVLRPCFDGYLVEELRCDKYMQESWVSEKWVDKIEEPIEPWTKVYAWNSNVNGKTMGWYIRPHENGAHEVKVNNCAVYPILFEFVEVME